MFPFDFLKLFNESLQRRSRHSYPATVPGLVLWQNCAKTPIVLSQLASSENQISRNVDIQSANKTAISPQLPLDTEPMGLLHQRDQLRRPKSERGGPQDQSWISIFLVRLAFTPALLGPLKSVSEVCFLAPTCLPENFVHQTRAGPRIACVSRCYTHAPQLAFIRSNAGYASVMPWMVVTKYPRWVYVLIQLALHCRDWILRLLGTQGWNFRAEKCGRIRKRAATSLAATCKMREREGRTERSGLLF